jgi:hypothetical protein
MKRVHEILSLLPPRRFTVGVQRCLNDLNTGDKTLQLAQARSWRQITAAARPFAIAMWMDSPFERREEE